MRKLSTIIISIALIITCCKPVVDEQVMVLKNVIKIEYITGQCWSCSNKVILHTNTSIITYSPVRDISINLGTVKVYKKIINLGGEYYYYFTN